MHLDSRDSVARRKLLSRCDFVIEAAAQGRIYGVRSSASAKIAHGALKEMADDLRQCPSLAILVCTARCHSPSGELVLVEIRKFSFLMGRLLDRRVEERPGFKIESSSRPGLAKNGRGWACWRIVGQLPAQGRRLDIRREYRCCYASRHRQRRREARQARRWSVRPTGRPRRCRNRKAIELWGRRCRWKQKIGLVLPARFHLRRRLMCRLDMRRLLAGRRARTVLIPKGDRRTMFEHGR